MLCTDKCEHISHKYCVLHIVYIYITAHCYVCKGGRATCARASAAPSALPFHTKNDLVYTERDVVHIERGLVHTERDLVHTERDWIDTERDSVHTGRYWVHSERDSVHTERDLFNTESDWVQISFLLSQGWGLCSSRHSGLREFPPLQNWRVTWPNLHHTRPWSQLREASWRLMNGS